jgi:hypothetical protein
VLPPPTGRELYFFREISMPGAGLGNISDMDKW